MKKGAAFLLTLVAGVVTLALLSGCEGPAGPAGEQGPEGINLEGFAEGIQCATCHSSDQDTTYNVAGRRFQWSKSLHATGGHSERNSTNCAGCHTTEGFQQRYREGWTTQVVGEVVNPSPPGCFACHSPHARADFSRRDMDAVTITSFIQGVPDAMFDYGEGNICVRCHQTRTSSPMSPKPDPTKTAITDTIRITSSRWYPHYGVNGQMLMGTGGFQFVDWTYTGSSNHATNTIIREEGCVKCHMAEPIGSGAGMGGGHTMWINYVTESGSAGDVLTGCEDAACHGSSINSTDFAGPTTAPVGAQTAIEANLDTLKQLLVARGWLNASTDLVIASSSNPLRIAPASRAGALYNYFFIEHEGSKGVHNTLYAYELLRSSIAEMRKP